MFKIKMHRIYMAYFKYLFLLQNDCLKCLKSAKTSWLQEGRRRGVAEEGGTADRVTGAETDPACSLDSGPRRVKEEVGLQHPAEAGGEEGLVLAEVRGRPEARRTQRLSTVRTRPASKGRGRCCRESWPRR